ncbi:MAG TPA: UbiA prenyltransferase family protein [Dehalococcoidia bacterium]|nr:UbiA prenyltransferase family protein [Dehalococcoidia bacterium]
MFAALAFSVGSAWDLDAPGDFWPLFWRTLALATLWSGAASATYLINDVMDREADRLHPRKATRPIASGALGVRAVIAIAILLLVMAMPLALLLNWEAAAILGGYVAVMMVYSFGLKSVAVLDVIILAAGVIARAVAGAIVIDVTISPWLYICSSFGALFLGVSKRWAEYRQLGESAARHRQSLAQYTLENLHHMLVISGAGALLSYALYSIESENVPTNGAMAITIPFVAFGMFRYMLLIAGLRSKDAPDQVLFTDPQILLSVAGFLAVAVTVLAAN